MNYYYEEHCKKCRKTWEFCFCGEIDEHGQDAAAAEQQPPAADNAGQAWGGDGQTMDDYETDYYDPDYADYGGMPDDEWDDDGPDETSYHAYLIKAKNGHIAIVQGVLGRYRGEDWGEASYWEENTLNISHLIDEQRLAIVAYAKDLEPGQHDFSFGWLDEDEEDDEMPTPPTSVDEIPF